MTDDASSRPDRPRRHYDGTGRKEQAAETRSRIVDAGIELLHGGSIRDWRSLTVRAAAERAGVNERTVYRHFGTEKGLRDAVMQRLEEEAGIELSNIGVADIPAVAARIFEQIASYPRERRTPVDPTLVDANQRQRDALLAAAARAAPSWGERDRTVAAAALDVLWSVGAYERLVVDWQLDHDEAVAGLTWAITLAGAAVSDGDAPGRPR